MEQFFADLCDDFTMAVKDGIISPGEGSFCLPAVEVNVIDRTEECESFLDRADFLICRIQVEMRQKTEYSFLYCSLFISTVVEDFQTVSPCQLSFDDVNGISFLIINVIAVEPA